MSPRLRKLIGLPLILLGLGAWVWLAVTIGERLPQSWWALTPFYALAGLGWGVPLIPLMRWMNGGDSPDPGSRE